MIPLISKTVLYQGQYPDTNTSTVAFYLLVYVQRQIIWCFHSNKMANADTEHFTFETVCIQIVLKLHINIYHYGALKHTSHIVFHPVIMVHWQIA